MLWFYPEVSKVSIKRYRIADGTPDAFLIQLEVMLTAFGFLNVQYFQGVSLQYYRSFQRMAFFSPE